MPTEHEIAAMIASYTPEEGDLVRQLLEDEEDENTGT